MAYLFDGTDDGLYNDFTGTYTAGVAHSYIIWFKTTDNTAFHQVCSYYNGGSEVWQMCFNSADNYAFSANRLFLAYRGNYVTDGAIHKQNRTVSGAFDGNWHNLIITKASGNNPIVYYDGSSTGWATTATIGENDVGFRFDAAHAMGGQMLPYNGPTYVNDNFNGTCAEYAFWDGVTLSAGDIAALQKMAPPLVRADKIKWYLPAIRDKNDPFDGATWVDLGAATVAEHPPLIRPSAPRILQFPPGVGAPAGTVPLLSHPHRHTNLGFG